MTGTLSILEWVVIGLILCPFELLIVIWFAKRLKRKRE